jgi:hypothetical protein
MKKSPATFRKAIAKAHSSRSLVRLPRSVEDGWINGYISLVGAEFFLVCVVSGEIRFDGFQAVRFADLTKVAVPAPHHEFVERALALRKLSRPVDPKIDVKDLGGLLTSGAAVFPMVTIHRETADPDVCHIGKVVALTAKTVTLREITPDAKWERKPRRYALREVTRVDFGGSYEEALHIVDQAT